MRLLRRLFAPVVVETSIDAPADKVYDVLKDPETYPEWLVGADKMRAVDGDFPRPGSKFEHSVGPGDPLTIDDRSESIAAEEDRWLALHVHAGPFHARVDFELRDRDDGGTDVCMSEQPIGPISAITPLLRPSLYGRNRLSLQRLREQVTGC
jgi:uncharacterized protein YndB with AHSA1/START domain